MYTPLIIFFIALFGIMIMIGRKWIMLQNGQTLERGEILFGVPHLEKVKHLTVRNAKKYAHLGLVLTIRFYVRSTNFIKNKYQEIKIRRYVNNPNSQDGDSPKKAEVSKFLKMISDYKRKIREIKHKIKEEENNPQL